MSVFDAVSWLRDIVFVVVLIRLVLFIRKYGFSGVLSRVSSAAVALPGASAVVTKEINREVENALKTMFKKDTVLEPITRIPEEGMEHEQLLESMATIKEQCDVDCSTGKAFAYVYPTTKTHKSMVERAYQIFMSDNALNPTAFPSLRRFEVEVVRMTATMVHGDEAAVGTMTSGGTESVLCSVLAYRERARDLHPHITQPEILMCISAHPCWEKAAHFFGLNTVYTPMREDFTADPEAIKAHITKNTVLIVMSATQYPHGVVDPITEVGAIAQAHDIPMHIDGCIGGFMLPWVEKLGYDVPTWDFRVPGVTSISLDCHKYGYAAKGASVVVYRSEDYRRYQFFAYARWPGGLFVSPSMLGTRAGGAIAAAWASLVGLGESGYLELMERMMSTVQYVREGIESIPELELMGKPAGTIVSFHACPDVDLNLLAVADVMETNWGWKIERLQHPVGIHMTINPSHFDVKEQFISNIREAIATVSADPSAFDTKGTAATYGMVAKIPSTDIVETFLTEFMCQVYK